MITIGLAAYSGIESYMLGMQKTADTFYEENNLEDLVVMGTSFSDDDLAKIQKLNNVKKSERKLVINANSNNDKQLLLSAVESNNIAKFHVYEGEKFDNRDGVWLDNYYAKENNLKVGDKILIKTDKFTTHQKIRALINTPDHLYDTRDASELVPDRKEFGFAYISSTILPAKIFNTIMVDVKDPETKSKTKEQILKEIQSASAVVNIEDTESYMRYQGEIDEGKTYVGVFSGIFLFIALLSVVTTMTRVIKKERTQIGTLKALGFSNLKILFHYIGYGFIIAVIAGFAGIWLGATLIGNLFMKIEMELFEIPPGKPVIDPSTWLVYAVVIFVVILISYLVGRKILRENPAETLKSEPVKIKREALNFSTKGFINKFGFITKWNLRDISRNKMRSIMGVAGIMGCTMMTVCAFGMLDSMNYFVDLQFSKLYNFEYKMTIADDVSEKRIKELIDRYSDKTSKSLAIEIKNGNTLDANNILVTDAGKLVKFINDKDEEIKELKENGVYLTRKLAEKYDLKVGDKISWRILGNNQYYNSEIIGLNKDPQNQNITMTRTYLKNLDIPYRPDTIYTNEKLKTKEISGISAIASCEDLRSGMSEMISRVKMLVVLIILIAVVLGTVIIYNLGILSYIEKQHQFATLKVLGFPNSKIRKIFIRQNNWIACVSIFLGLPLGFLMTDFLFTMSLEETYDFNAHINLRTYIIAAVGTFIISWLVSLLLAKKIAKIDMVSSLKADE